MTERKTVTLYVPDGYADAEDFLRDCQFEPAETLPATAQEYAKIAFDNGAALVKFEMENVLLTRRIERVTQYANDLIRNASGGDNSEDNLRATAIGRNILVALAVFP